MPQAKYMPAEREKITIDINRVNGKTTFEFKVPTKVTNFYKEIAQETRDSSNWKGLKFFFLPSITDDPQYKRDLEYARLFDDFGAGLYKEGRLNIAWLRTVSGEGKIVVSDALSFSELSVLVQNCVKFIKKFIEQYHADFKLNGTITMDV